MRRNKKRKNKKKEEEKKNFVQKVVYVSFVVVCLFVFW